MGVVVDLSQVSIVLHRSAINPPEERNEEDSAVKDPFAAVHYREKESEDDHMDENSAFTPATIIKSNKFGRQRQNRRKLYQKTSGNSEHGWKTTRNVKWTFGRHWKAQKTYWTHNTGSTCCLRCTILRMAESTQFEEDVNRKMLGMNVIERPLIDSASQIVAAPKKYNLLPSCIDNRMLNSVTFKDAYRILQMEEYPSSLLEARIFSTRDANFSIDK